MIKVNKLNKYYNKGKLNENHIINDTSVEFGNSGLVCILGESGSGKTTFLNTVGGLDTFSSGTIQIDDTTFMKYSEKSIEAVRNSRFAYIFQDQYLLEDSTVAYNIGLALNMYDLSDEEREERIDYVLQAVDLRKYRKRLVSQLSGGQKQRVAIARALVKAPDIIFADEPTGNLDEANTMRIMGIIKKISKDCLVILVTHEKRIAEFFADRIIYIQDGKITSDVKHKGNDIYHHMEDTNLYLKEFKKDILPMGKVNIHVYSNEIPDKDIVEKSNVENININLVYQNGKLYIQAANPSNVVMLDQETEIQMVDDVRPVIELRHLEENNYELSKLKEVKGARLSLREIYRLSKSNAKILGRKQLFMIITFIITAVLLVFSVMDYLTIASIDRQSFVTDDSHYVFINAKRNSAASNTQYYGEFNEIYNTFLNQNITEDVYIDLNTKLGFYYDSFGQIGKISNTLPEAAYVTLEHLDQKDLILGRMPQKRDEIVIDKWVAEVFLDSSILKNLMKLKDFINLKVTSDLFGSQLTIVGISDVNEPVIYVNKYMGISMAAWADSIASLDQLKDSYPGQFDDIKLGANEVMVSEAKYADMIAKGEKEFIGKNLISYQVAGTYPDDYKVTYVLEDSYYNEVLNSYICVNRKFKVYGEGKEDTIHYFSPESGNYDMTYVEMLIEDTYQEQMDKYQAERAVRLNARSISTLAVFLIAMFLLFFTMKSNAMKRSDEIAVYRLLGITKGSILSAFTLEVIWITNATILPVILALSCIIKFLAVIPTLQLTIVYPWIAMVTLLGFFYVVNIIVGIIPVYQMIKQPPARLSQKL